MKICIAVDIGGHLSEGLLLSKAFEGHDVFYVMIDTPRKEQLSHRCYTIPWYCGRLWQLRLGLLLPRFLWILVRERPQVIFSTGAEIAVPFFYMGKALGARTIFVESITRVNMPSKTGRVVYPIADTFLVQHQNLLRHYGKKARFEGSLF